MIVACRSKSNLKECFESLNGPARDEYKLFKAECKNLCYDEVRSFYGLYVSNEKVTTAIDYVSTELLQERFPFADESIITEIIANQGTWTSCCDVLSSMISSHGNVFFNNTDFFIGNHNWPSVQETIRRCHIINGEQSLSDDWSIFELSGFDDLLPSKILNVERDGRFSDEMTACMEDWEIVESDSRVGGCTKSSSDLNCADKINQISGAFRTVNLSDNTCAKVCGGTYRDVLMTPKIVDIKKLTMEYDQIRSISQPYKWKPRFEVTKTGRKRVDRCYGHHHEVSATSNYNDDEDYTTEDLISNEMEMFVRARA